MAPMVVVSWMGNQSLQAGEAIETMSMRRRSAIIRYRSRAVVAALCAVSVLASAPGWTADTDIVINEVSYLGNLNDDWVELTNTGSGMIDVSSWWLCARFSYRQVGGLAIIVGDDLVIGPNEILVVAAGMDLNNTASDLGLYTTNSFASTAAMVDFVQWGTSVDVGRADVAADKGIWTEISTNSYDFVPTAPAQTTLAYSGMNGGGGLLTLSTDFTNGTHSQGAENPIFADGFESGDTDFWSSAIP